MMLYFQSHRPGGYGSIDIWMSRRASLSDPWGPPVNLGPKINSSGFQGWARVSPDGSTLYFLSIGLDGTYDNWQVPIIPVDNLNSDEVSDTVR
jgi:hypothetical protein